MKNSRQSGSGESPAYRETILVIRFSSLGDILLTAPAVRALRNRYPNAHIDLLVAEEFAEAASLIPGPDRVLTFDRKSGLTGLWKLRNRLSRRYSILVDLQNSPRSAFLRLFTFPMVWVRAKRYRFRRWLLIQFKWNRYREKRPVPLRYLDALSLFGIADDGEGLKLTIPDLMKGEIGEDVSTKPVAVLCPGARHNTKRWPGERWIELGQRLAAAGWSINVVVSAVETGLGSEIRCGLPNAELISNYSIPKIAALFERATVVISNDSGLMHLAAGVGTPVAAIFGPTVEEFGFFPFRGPATVLEHKLDCRPCSAMGGRQCPQTHFRCMLDTAPADVLAAVDRMTPMKHIPARES